MVFGLNCRKQSQKCPNYEVKYLTGGNYPNKNNKNKNKNKNKYMLAFRRKAKIIIENYPCFEYLRWNLKYEFDNFLCPPLTSMHELWF